MADDCDTSDDKERQMSLNCVVAIALMMLFCTSPRAGEACLRAPRDAVLRSFAQKLSQTYPEVRNGKTKAKECLENLKKKYADCEFTDKDGVRYLVEGSEVIRVEVWARDEPRTVLPFGLSFREGLQVSKRMVAAAMPENAVQQTSNGGGDIVVAPLQCLSNEEVAQFDMYLIVDQDGLAVFGLREPW